MEPLNKKIVRHYLDFINNGDGVFEIDEPFSFDSANFVVEQRSGEYGRDVSFAGGEVDFTFVNKQNILGHQFDRLIEYNTIYGYESEVKYMLSVDDGANFYVIGNLDFTTAETDSLLEFSCSVIQETQQAIIKRRIESAVDLLGTEDLNGQEIAPVSTERVLLKAIPQSQDNKWGPSLPWYSLTHTLTGSFHFLNQNPISTVLSHEITKTLAGSLKRGLLTFLGDPDFLNKVYDFGFIEPDYNLTNTKVKIENIKISYFISPGANIEDSWINTNRSFRAHIVVFPKGLDNYTASDIAFTTSADMPYTAEFIGTENVERFNAQFSKFADRYDLTFDTVEISLPGVSVGHRLCVYYNVGRQNTITEWLEGNMSISTLSTAVNSVTEAVRLVDAMGQVVNNIDQGYSIDAPRFSENGEWYDNYIFNGNLIRGITDRAFILRMKDIQKGLLEFNSDYEVNNNVVSFMKYDDFYTDNEMDSFSILPDSTFKTTYSDRYSINKFNFAYKTFNQDEDDGNTLEAVHTQLELSLRNMQVENSKEIDIPFIRDPFMMETTRIKGINSKPTTSLSQDDKVFIFDVVPLDTGDIQSITAVVNMNIDGGNLQLLNDNSFNWKLLGFNKGDNFYIDNTDNSGAYSVVDYTLELITLSPSSSTPLVEIEGDIIIEVSYFLTNVNLTIRTSEGFDKINNTKLPKKYPNLRYTPKRNILNNWGSYLKTSTLYNNKHLQTRYYKNGGNLSTQLTGGTLISEKADIQQSELSSAILDARIVTAKVIIDFSTLMALINNIKTVRGYITILDNLGARKRVFPQKLDYNWGANILEITGELKNESLFMTIKTDSSGNFVIMESGYEAITISEFEYKASNDKIRFFDENGHPLTRKIRFDFIKVEGVSYTNLIDLITAIDNLRKT